MIDHVLNSYKGTQIKELVVDLSRTIQWCDNFDKWFKFALAEKAEIICLHGWIHNKGPFLRFPTINAWGLGYLSTWKCLNYWALKTEACNLIMWLESSINCLVMHQTLFLWCSMIWELDVPSNLVTLWSLPNSIFKKVLIYSCSLSSLSEFHLAYESNSNYFASQLHLSLILLSLE